METLQALVMMSGEMYCRWARNKDIRSPLPQAFADTSLGSSSFPFWKPRHRSRFTSSMPQTSRTTAPRPSLCSQLADRQDRSTAHPRILLMTVFTYLAARLPAFPSKARRDRFFPLAPVPEERKSPSHSVLPE
ncbi:hypothetical protein VUR80DRAFT_1378 [Thermomyces stellatus]